MIIHCRVRIFTRFHRNLILYIYSETDKLDKDIKYMKKALVQASHALELGEVPIGCVIVCGDKVVGRGYNRRNTKKSTLAHAEMTAIDQASRKLGDWRLEGCTMYVTLEPCQMCSGAIVQSRIDRVVIGAMNPKAGCAGSILDILHMPQFNHQVETTIGICGQECSDILQEFFKDLRERNRAEKAAKRAAEEALRESALQDYYTEPPQE